MEYSKLIAVSGLSGLFELLTSKSDGAIAKSLENDTTQFISSRAHQFSHLESIEVFTTRENVFLAEVFIAMGKSKEALPNEKEAKSVEAYFKKTYPNMDFTRVYASDMKKMIKWFAQLQKHKVEPTLPEADEEAEAEEAKA
jgi:rRNA maturation endonuclease Nob1